MIVLDHHRRRVTHFEVTRNPTQVWVARQIAEAFPWDTAPRYLLRDPLVFAGYGPPVAWITWASSDTKAAEALPDWEQFSSVARERYQGPRRRPTSSPNDCPDPAASSFLQLARSSHFRRSAACIIATNVARPEPPQSIGRGCITQDQFGERYSSSTSAIRPGALAYLADPGYTS